MFFQFLLYNKVTQFYIYIFFFSHYPPSCSITRDWIVSCATQQGLIAYPLQSLHLPTPNSQSIPLPPPPSWKPLFSMSVSLFLFCLTYLVWQSLGPPMLCCKWHYSFFLCLSNIPYLPHHLYPFTVSGHLDYFYFLTVVNRTITNVGVHVSFLLHIFIKI